ncbi:MAG: hypothetical protein CL916_15400 [Deltaproteobacteria bacterium]|nr:hypothetical protein [Deltaproteobacteria bacterium]
MYSIAYIVFSSLYCSCTVEGTKSSIDSISGNNTTAQSDPSNNEDILRSLYLLEQSTDGENLIWELHIQSKDISLLGSLDCPFSVPNDKLAAMTADPKGILWALSEEYQIMRIAPATLVCTSFPQLASTEEFQAESLAFIQNEEGVEFFLAGYYGNPQGGASTALAQLSADGIEIIAPITNFEGQDTVIDIDTTPDQRLFGYRGWGNLSELLSLNAQTGSEEYSQTIYISTEQNFALLSDNQTHWFFTNTGPQGSQLHRYQNDLLEWWMDIPFIVVGASGIE